MDKLFFFFSFVGVASSLLVIFSENPVYSVFYLIIVFCVTTCSLLLLTVDFLGVIFVIIYVGAIAVLFLFVVMMLNIRLLQLTDKIVGYFPLLLLLGIFLIAFCFFEVEDYYFVFSLDNLYKECDYILLLEHNEVIFGLGNVVYTYYGYAFLLSGMSLLLGMVGSICLTLYHSSDVKRQHVYKQVGRGVISSIFLYKK